MKTEEMWKCLCFARFPLPVPLARQGHIGRHCAPAASVFRLWQRDGRLPWDLPSRQHPAGAAALHPHCPSGNLVLGGEKERQLYLTHYSAPWVISTQWHRCSAHLPSPWLLRSVSCSTLLVDPSGTSAITATWCSSPCVTPGTWRSPCSSWACCTVSSAGRTLVIVSRLISTEIKVHISVFGWLSAAWSAPGWRGHLQWRWDCWSRERGIPNRRTRHFEETLFETLQHQFREKCFFCCSIKINADRETQRHSSWTLYVSLPLPYLMNWTPLSSPTCHSISMFLIISVLYVLFSGKDLLLFLR